jgi:hypothetical protein
MKTLRSFLKEDVLVENKNTHMEHLEDLVFNEGVVGTRRAIFFLRDLRDMLAGSSTGRLATTVKWDGAPAVFAGVDPRDGKFFVAKKGVFNKDPKVYKTPQEIDADTQGDLAAKLKIALVEFKKFGIKSGVFQGDLMFTNDKKVETIDGQKYITFHPNTIVYAVPFNSELGKQIRKAKIGVVWHTTYTGSSFESMTASFGMPIVSKFKQNPSVWMDDATYKDFSGTATFTASETAEVTSMLSEVGKMFQGMNASTLNAISKDPDLLMLVKTYNNSKIRAGQLIHNVDDHVVGLFNYITDKYKKEEDSKKTDKGKQAVDVRRKKIMSFFANHPKQEIVKIFHLANNLTIIKNKIVSKMNQAGGINTFIRTANGFRVTGVEGFVAIDRMTGGAVKIVDRMEFSKANFSPDVIKGWQR